MKMLKSVVLLGIVVTTSPTCNLMNNKSIIYNHHIFYTHLYNIVVFPAPSNPKISILSSFDPHKRAKRLEKKLPKEVKYI